MRPSQILAFQRPLWDHQKETLDRFANHYECALFHEMGTGKTTTAISWLRWKWRKHDKILPTLIVAPLATLEGWRREIEAATSPLVASQVEVLSGPGSRRVHRLKTSEAKIFILNPQTFDMPAVVSELRLKGFSAVVVDESHGFKGYKSKRLKQLLSVSDATMYRMILSGTPVLNDYTDLWSQWRILDRGDTFGVNFFLFRERYFRDANVAWKGKSHYFPKYEPRAEAGSELARLSSVKASRILKKDCLSLPPVVRKTEYVSMSPEQAKAYAEMERDLVAAVKSGECVATNALTQVLRLLQILSGYLQFEEGRYRLQDSPRMTRLRELLEELTPSHKVIVWCVFEEDYARISQLCSELGIQHAELTGRIKDKQKEIECFKSHEPCRVMISNPQAGGVGVDGLQVSDYAIYYSRSFSLGDRLQSEARNHRGGSEIHEKITLIDLVTPQTMDEVVLESLLRKENLASSILEKIRSR